MNNNEIKKRIKMIADKIYYSNPTKGFLQFKKLMKKYPNDYQIQYSSVAFYIDYGKSQNDMRLIKDGIDIGEKQK